MLVPFGFTDQTGMKWRPAIVVSTDRYNEETPDVLIASVTGNLRAIPHPGDHRLVDWQGAGLLVPSLGQTKLGTVDASILGRRLGALSSTDLSAIERGLREALGLA